VQVKLEVWNENMKMQGDAHIGSTSIAINKQVVAEAAGDRGKEFTLPLAQVR
jgi:hypothetical protein